MMENMITGYVKLEHGFDVATDLFEKMPEGDLISWNLMIGCCVKNEKLEMASLLFDKMRERDVVSWATMVDGYAKNGSVDVDKPRMTRLHKYYMASRSGPHTPRPIVKRQLAEHLEEAEPMWDSKPI